MPSETLIILAIAFITAVVVLTISQMRQEDRIVRFEALEKAIENISARLETADTQISRHYEDMHKYFENDRSRLRFCEERLNNLEDQDKSTKGKLAETLATFHDLCNQNGGINDKIDALQGNYADLEKTVDYLVRRIAKIENPPRESPQLKQEDHPSELHWENSQDIIPGPRRKTFSDLTVEDFHCIFKDESIVNIKPRIPIATETPAEDDARRFYKANLEAICKWDKTWKKEMQDAIDSRKKPLPPKTFTETNPEDHPLMKQAWDETHGNGSWEKFIKPVTSLSREEIENKVIAATQSTELQPPISNGTEVVIEKTIGAENIPWKKFFTQPPIICAEGAELVRKSKEDKNA